MQGAPNIQIEDVQYTTRIITNRHILQNLNEFKLLLINYLIKLIWLNLSNLWNLSLLLLNLLT